MTIGIFCVSSNSRFWVISFVPHFRHQIQNTWFEFNGKKIASILSRILIIKGKKNAKHVKAGVSKIAFNPNRSHAGMFRQWGCEFHEESKDFFFNFMVSVAFIHIYFEINSFDNEKSNDLITGNELRHEMNVYFTPFTVFPRSLRTKFLQSSPIPLKIGQFQRMG